MARDRGLRWSASRAWSRSSRTPKFTGPIANALDGADLSLFIGLPVAAGLYLWFARSIDVEAERRIAEREAEELEELAAEHAMPTASV